MANAKLSKSKVLSKKEQVIKLLKRPNGASLAEISKVTGWQDHSIRGFLSGTVKKRLGLEIESFKDKKKVRRYRILKSVKGSQAKQTEHGMAVDAQSTTVA